MTTLQSAETLTAFHHFVNSLEPTPEVCPEIPPPSLWAAEMLNFHAQGQQSAVLDHDAHRLILCCARQWGKTTLIAIKALHAAIFQPRTEILVIASSERLAGRLVAKACAMAAILGHRRRRVPGYKYSLQLPNGSLIYAVAHSERTGAHGCTAHIVIVDEAANVADDVVGSASPALGRTNGKLWLLSVPNGQQGLFFNVWHNRQLTNWLRVKATIHDIPFTTPGYIQEQLRLFPFNIRQDFYCEFTAPRGRLLDADRVNQMIDPSLTVASFPPYRGENAANTKRTV